MLCVLSLAPSEGLSARRVAAKAKSGRAAAKKRQKVVVFVGLPGSGKSTLAKAVGAALHGAKRTSFGDQIRAYVNEKGWKRTPGNDIKASQHFAQNPAALARRVVKKIKELGAEWTLVDGAREPVNIEALRKHFDVSVVSMNVPTKVRFQRMLARKRFANETPKYLQRRDKRELGLGVGDIMQRADWQVADTPLHQLSTAARVLAEGITRGTGTKLRNAPNLGGTDWAYQLQNLRQAAESVPQSGRARFLSKTLLSMPRIAGGPRHGYVVLRDMKAESLPWQKDHLLMVPSRAGHQPAWLHQVKDPRRLGRMARTLGKTIRSLHKSKGGFSDVRLWVNLPARLSMPVLHLHAQGVAEGRYPTPDVTSPNFLEAEASTNGPYKLYRATSPESSWPIVAVATSIPSGAAAKDHLLGQMIMDVGLAATKAGIYDGRVEITRRSSEFSVQAFRRLGRTKKRR